MFKREFRPELAVELAERFAGSYADPKQLYVNWHQTMPPNYEMADFLKLYAKIFLRRHSQPLSQLEALAVIIADHYVKYFERFPDEERPRPQIISDLVSEFKFWESEQELADRRAKNRATNEAKAAANQALALQSTRVLVSRSGQRFKCIYS